MPAPLTAISRRCLDVVASLALLLSVCEAAHSANSTDATPPAGDCAATYSILRDANHSCSPPPSSRSHAPTSAVTTEGDAETPIDSGWLRAEMAAFAVIGVAHVRGGTSTLRTVWYSGALLVPPFMATDADYGLRKNYLAVTPPFIALGMINDYLHRDRATDSRIFLTNFIAFNVGLLWSRNVLDNPGHFLERSPVRVAWQPAMDRDHRFGLITLDATW